MTDWAADLDVALRAARLGEVPFLERRDVVGHVRSESKEYRRELVTEADRAVEEVVVGAILAERPDDAILAEEGALTPKGSASSDSDRVWVIDPIDGTTNYVHGLPFCCIAVALVEAGQPVVGVVHAPVLGRTWSAALGAGARRDDQSIAVTQTELVRDALLSTGFSYNRNEPGRDDNVERLRRALPACRDLRRYGSAEMDLCMVADGTYDGYWEMYLAPYDVAAGAVIVREAGGRVTDLLGGDSWMFGQSLLATNDSIHAEMLELVGGSVPGA